MILVSPIISSTDVEMNDGDTMDLDLNGSGMRNIKFSIDGQQINIPLIDQPTSLSDKKGMPSKLFDEMVKEAHNRLSSRNGDTEYIDNRVNLSQGPDFVLRMEHLPITYSLSDPKYNCTNKMPKFDPNLVVDEIKTHILGLYRIVKRNQDTRNLSQVLDDTKFAEAWVDNYLKSQTHILEVNHVNIGDPKYKVLELTGNTFKNMYKRMRNDYTNGKINFKTYKMYLKAAMLLVQKVIPEDKSNEVK